MFSFRFSKSDASECILPALEESLEEIFGVSSDVLIADPDSSSLTSVSESMESELFVLLSLALFPIESFEGRHTVEESVSVNSAMLPVSLVGASLSLERGSRTPVDESESKLCKHYNIMFEFTVVDVK